MDISLDLSLTLAPPEDPEAFLREYVGQIIEIETGERAGTVHAFVLNAERSRDYGHDPFQVLDTRAATSPYMELVSQEDAGDFTPSVLRVLQTDFVLDQNMLIINRLEVLPQYRGRDLGLQAMHLLLVHLSMGCRLAAIKPFPLQFEPKSKWSNEMYLGSFKGSKNEAKERLRTHYARLGFKPIGRTGLMICDLENSEALRWPTLPS